ncbi:DeoR/GlpR family DNA-binding transcription regulator [Falsiroseomonas sp. CW058]|uniref:DeoR/GlpR family DNA-binding transcription regulator n=1 Tax=Falsiroseomonas sp. CW058 TaxID=3388664 RepID=UPI003D31D985
MPRLNDGAPDKTRRHQRILAALATDPTVRISALAAQFGVSAETVRRDVEELSRLGAVRRTYGGASVVAAGQQPELSSRERMAVAERARIGAAAAAMVQPGDVVMLDAGSTTGHMARALAMRGIRATVLTNSLPAAQALSAAPGGAIRVILCPGDVSAAEQGVYGPETAAFLERFHADLAFVGASGLTPEGPCDVETRAVWVKRAMLARAGRRLLLVDHEKFGRAVLERVCPLEDLTGLVTDSAPTGRLAEVLARAGVDLTLAQG